MVSRTKQVSGDLHHQQERSEALKCPRCGSTNTKFCYYNNYNKSQPRHFCKSCKRHWTKGGTLRNVPVGGGRKYKRPNVSVKMKNMPSNNYASNSSSIYSFKGFGDEHKGFNKGFDRSSLYSLNNGMMINDANTGLNLSVSHQNISSEHEHPIFANLSTFSENLLLINPISYQSTNDHIDREYATMTIVDNIIPCTGAITWQENGSTTSNNAEDSSNYWNWNDIDALATHTMIS